MASGTAVVMTDCGGVRDYVVDGYNSLVVPPGDPEAVANATIEILRNDRLRDRLIRGGVETARQWTWDRVVDKFEEAIRGRQALNTAMHHLINASALGTPYP